MNYVADMLEMPKMRVYEVATFYTMFNRFGNLYSVLGTDWIDDDHDDDDDDVTTQIQPNVF